MSSMAFMFVGFASVRRVEMMYPNNLPEGTPKVHFVGFSFMSNLLKFSNVPKRSQIRSLGFLRFDDNVIDIGFYILTDLRV